MTKEHERAKLAEAMSQVSQVWAEEPGVTLGTEPAGPGFIKFRVMRRAEILAEATIAEFRWQRIADCLGATETERTRLRDHIDGLNKRLDETAAALAAEGARADEAGWRRGRQSARDDSRASVGPTPSGNPRFGASVWFLDRDYTPPAERPTL